MKAADLFAGCGGLSIGAEHAGAEIVFCANHWQFAVDAHAMNHPGAEHRCARLEEADWTTLPDFNMLLAAPACQGNSSASRPRRRVYHDKLRATAWAVVDCAQVTQPDVLLVENVPSMRSDWILYDLWLEALRRLGYHLQEHVLTASHFGVPQRRRRLFITGTRKPVRLDLNPSTVEPAFGPSIDWDQGRWRPVDQATEKVRERIARGRKRLGRRFLSQHVTNHPGVALDEPIRTITTGDQWVVVDGDHYRPLTVRENARAMGFPEDYRWPEGATRAQIITGLGNAVCPPQAKALVGALLAA